MFFPTDGFGKCVLLAKVFRSPNRLRLARFFVRSSLYAVFFSFSLSSCLWLPARPTLIFLRKLLSRTGFGSVRDNNFLKKIRLSQTSSKAEIKKINKKDFKKNLQDTHESKKQELGESTWTTLIPKPTSQIQGWTHFAPKTSPSHCSNSAASFLAHEAPPLGLEDETISALTKTYNMHTELYNSEKSI